MGNFSAYRSPEARARMRRQQRESARRLRAQRAAARRAAMTPEQSQALAELEYVEREPGYGELSLSEARRRGHLTRYLKSMGPKRPREERQCADTT